MKLSKIILFGGQSSCVWGWGVCIFTDTDAIGVESGIFTDSCVDSTAVSLIPMILSQIYNVFSK